MGAGHCLRRGRERFESSWGRWDFGKSAVKALRTGDGGQKGWAWEREWLMTQWDPSGVEDKSVCVNCEPEKKWWHPNPGGNAEDESWGLSTAPVTVCYWQQYSSQVFTLWTVPQRLWVHVPGPSPGCRTLCWSSGLLQDISLTKVHVLHCPYDHFSFLTEKPIG